MLSIGQVRGTRHQVPGTGHMTGLPGTLGPMIGDPTPSPTVLLRTIIQYISNNDWRIKFCYSSKIPTFCRIRIYLISTQTRFAPLRALTPFEVYIGPYLVSLNGQKVLVVLVVVILSVPVVDPISN